MLKYHLTPNKLRLSKGDYFARTTHSNAFEMEEILDLMLERGSSLTRGDAKLALQVFHETVYQLLKDGASVQTPLFQANPKIMGKFLDSEDVFDANRHSVRFDFQPSKEVKALQSEVVTEKLKLNPPAPILTEVEDVSSKTKNQSLSKGGVVIIRGSLLKCDPSKPENGVFFINSEKERIRCNQIIENRPSKLMIVIPAELPNGDYQLEVCTNIIKARSVQLLRTGAFKKSLQVVD